MKTSEQVNEIAAALVKAQATIQAVVKDKTGKIQGKDGKQGYEYKYSDLASVIEHVKGPLNDNGICFIQSPARAEGGVQVATRLLHVSGQWVESEVYMPVPYGSAQAYGSAITYCKRYGLQSMTGLPSEDDDGEKASKDQHGKTVEDRTHDYSKHTARQVAVDSLAEQTPEEQQFLREKAIEIIAVHADNGNVFAHVERQHFDTEQKLALWSLLPSPVRSAIKKQSLAARLPSQP